MKRLIGIICVVLALTLAMTAISFAATADIVNESAEGTATVDGTKDEAYDAATALEFVQKGSSNGGSEVLDEPIGRAYIINDSDWVYVWFEVYDSSLDNASANTYEQDSCEFFWMDDDSKYQLRVCYDGSISADTGSDWADKGAEFVAVTTDDGFAVEAKFPITDVLDNQIEMCLQINAATDGSRDYTCYILGNDAADNAYQRNTRESDYDVWWTLTLAGEHEDTRVDLASAPGELIEDNYLTIQEMTIGVQAYTQESVSWSNWTSVGSFTTITYGSTTDVSWDYDAYTFDGLITADLTADWTVNPALAIQIQDNGNLLLADDAEVGDTGDSGRFTYTYSDITLVATGYDDIVIPGETVTSSWQIKQENGYTSGTSKAIDLLAPIMEATGLDLQGVAEQYLPALTNISFSVSFDAYELIYPEDIEAYLVALDEEDTALLAELQEYIDRVDAAEEIINNEESTLEEMQEALSADTTEEEEVVEDEDTSADTSSSSSSSSSSGVVVGIIIVIVVIVVVVVVVVVTGKKKKK